MKKQIYKRWWFWVIVVFVVVIGSVMASNDAEPKDAEKPSPSANAPAIQTEPSDTENDNTPAIKPEDGVQWYSASTYKVGVDIPAGEYYLENTGPISAYMAVYGDSSGSNILVNENFETHYYITLESGQYFEISSGRALPVNSLQAVFSAGELSAGMYRVGADIPAGEYKLTEISPGASLAYMCVYDNSSANQEIQTNDIFEGSKYITVTDGQYLYLSGCSGSLVN
jgi:hypothetical protein